MNSARTRLILYLAATFGSACVSNVSAKNLEEFIVQMQNGEEKKDFSIILDGMEGVGDRLGEIYLKQTLPGAITSKLKDELMRGMDIYAGNAIELDVIVEIIEKDTELLKTKEVAWPTFDALLTFESHVNLTSSKSFVRRSALEKTARECLDRRANIEAKLERYRLEQTKARLVWEETKATVARGQELEKLLKKINESAAGPLSNLGGQKFAWAFVDMSLYVNPALKERRNASEILLKKYDRAVASIEAQLSLHDNFAAWVQYYRWEEWIREQLPLDTNLQDAREKLAEIQGLNGRKTNNPSKESQAISDLIYQIVQETNATQLKASALIETARHKDSMAAAHQGFNNLLNLSATIIGATAADGKQTVVPEAISQPPVVIPMGWRFRELKSDSQPSQNNIVPLGSKP